MGFYTKYRTPLLLSSGILAVGFLSSFYANPQMSSVITEMLILLIGVIGLYVFIGNSGIISFGHSSFMCIGAYAAGWCSVQPMYKTMMLSGLPSVLKENQYPFLVGVLLAACLSAMVALLFGAVILRLSGMAAAIATFSFLMIVNGVYSNWTSVTAGISTIVGVPKVVGPGLAALFAAVSVLLAYLFQISRYGLMLKASRDDAVAAEASAVNIKRMRLIAFVLSAAMAGVAGSLYAHFIGVLAVEQFYLKLTFLLIAMLVVGGMFSLTGAVVGVVGVTIIVQILRALEAGVPIGSNVVSLPPGSQEIGLGIILALVLIFRPSGITKNREL